MPAEKAVRAFREARKSCAQSVLYGFQDVLSISDDAIDAAKKLGGGRAEEGRCGALHAALQLSRGDKTRERLKRAFEEAAGSQHCREIRARKHLRCDECVKLAATVLAQEEHGELRQDAGTEHKA